MSMKCVTHRNPDFKNLLGVITDEIIVPVLNPENPNQASYGAAATTICSVVWYEKTEEGYKPSSKMPASMREEATALVFVGFYEDILKNKQFEKDIKELLSDIHDLLVDVADGGEDEDVNTAPVTTEG